MNIWLSENFFLNKKVKRLYKELGADAIISLQKLWLYAARYAIDNLLDEEKVGILKDFDSIDIELNAEWIADSDSLYSALKRLKLITKKNHHYYIHDFADNNPHIVELIKKKINGSVYAKRRWEAKKKKDEIGDPIGTQTVTQYKGKVIEENVRECNTKDTVGQTEKKPDDRMKIYQLVLDDLNEKTGRKFTLTKRVISIMNSRWKEGHREPQFLHVNLVCSLKWKDDVEHRDHLAPLTLYNGNFEKRLHWKVPKPPEEKEYTGRLCQ